MDLTRTLGSLALGVLLITSHPMLSAAQEPPETTPADEPTAPEEEPPGDIEAIQITGEILQVTDVQDEAQAISAFSAEDLDRANIVNVDSLAFSVPGLHVGQIGTAAIITLRGIGTENASLTGEPGVAFHVDGINYGRPSAARVAFFDLESLDVKRGPQGLLGGKNSTSGSINLITKKPHDEYEVEGDVLFGNYDRVRIRGALNIPISEFAAARLALFHEDRDGYLDNLLVSDSRDPFDADDFGLRAHLRLNPTDSLEVLFSYNYFKQKGNGAQADVVPRSPYDPGCNRGGAGLTVLPAQAACNRTPSDQRLVINPVTGFPEIVEFGALPDFATEDSDPRSILVDTVSGQDNRYWGWSSTIDWDTPSLPLLGETRLKLLGGFQKTLTEFNQDFDATDRGIFDFDLEENAQQWTGELQWGGMLAERLEWQMSGFYAHEEAFRNVSTPGIRGLSAGVSTDQTTENKSYGAALHTTLHVTDNIRWALGGRMIKDVKETWLLRVARSGEEGRFRGCTGDLRSLGSPRRPARPNPACEGTFRGQMWGSSIDWRPFGADHLLYARIDRGYKGGGFRAGAVGEYLPEKIWAYAAGTKSEFFDQRLRLNLEGFFYAYDALQLVLLDGLALRTENTDARMYGWDLETVASPIPGLTISGIVSYLHTETIDYFSLDPALISQLTDPAANNEYRQRLFKRDIAEDQIAEGLVGASTFAQLGCDPPGVSCGSLGDRDGLDDYSGNKLSRSPKWKYTISAEYEIPLGRFGFLTPRIQYTWQDDVYFRAFNQDFELQKDHHLTDIKLVWTDTESVWEVEAFIQNIEDEAPKTNILTGPREFTSPPYAWYGPPRFYGIRVGFKY